VEYVDEDDVLLSNDMHLLLIPSDTGCFALHCYLHCELQVEYVDEDNVPLSEEDIAAVAGSDLNTYFCALHCNLHCEPLSRVS
jgi:hypothetical protein